jgi:hypothetical protein
VLAKTPSQALQRQLDEAIDAIEAAQEPDGYLDTYFTLEEPAQRWTNLNFMHELYCAGHLIQAAVAHYRATGSDRLLNVARRLADHIVSVFGPGKQGGYPGHQEIEMALVELYRTTGERGYFDLAVEFVERRGRKVSPFQREFEKLAEIGGTNVDSYDDFHEHTRRLYLTESGGYDGRYAQDHLPVREQRTVEGHAVRAMYMYAGMADIAAENGDIGLLGVLDRLWRNMTQRRMYITGGIGSSSANEGFTSDYDLPNASAYAETCAAVGSIIWNLRMFLLTGEGRFIDVLERTLYNGFLAGVALDGKKFSYVNPLESAGEHHRQNWYTCACCPPNAARLLASLGIYVYAQTDSEIYVNLYIAGCARARLQGRPFTVYQRTRYPWEGTVQIEIQLAENLEFSLNLRIPDWCNSYHLAVNGTPVAQTPSHGYVRISRVWRPRDLVEFHLDMPVKKIEAYPAVRSCRGKSALQRGPLIYCLEGVDNPYELSSAVLPASSPMSDCSGSGELAGLMLITGEVRVPPRDQWKDRLYHEAGSSMIRQRFTAVPYYFWDNRRPGEMIVWIRSNVPENGEI